MLYPRASSRIKKLKPETLSLRYTPFPVQGLVFRASGVGFWILCCNTLQYHVASSKVQLPCELINDIQVADAARKRQKPLSIHPAKPGRERSAKAGAKNTGTEGAMPPYSPCIRRV